MSDFDSTDPVLTGFQQMPPHIGTTDVIQMCSGGSCSVVTTDSELATFVLPWWKTVPDSTGFGCQEEGHINYTPYQVFCLQTRITPFCQTMLGLDCISTFLSTFKAFKMHLVLVLNRYSPPEFSSDSNPNIESSFNTLRVTQDQRLLIQNKIDEILTVNEEACLVFPINSEARTLKGDGIPKWWTKQILPFVSLNSAYRPFCDSDGFHVILADWVDTIPGSEVVIKESYDDKYHRILRNIVAQIQKMYNDGYVTIYNPDKAVLTAWELIPMDDDGVLYKPNWKNPRMIPNLVEFILARVRQESSFYISIASDDTPEDVLAVYYHFIAQELNQKGVQFKFCGFMIELQVDSVGTISKLQELWSGIQEAKTKQDMAGILKIETMQGPSSVRQQSCVSYSTFDLFKPFVLSCLESA